MKLMRVSKRSLAVLLPLACILLKVFTDLAGLHSMGGTRQDILFLLNLLSLLFLPGFALRLLVRKVEDHDALALIDLAALAVPGIILLSLYGVALWVLKLGPHFTLGRLFAYGVLLLSLALVAFATYRRDLPTSMVFPRAWYLPFLLFLFAVSVAICYSLVNIPVNQEQYANSSWRTRMIASPPDAVIPYQTGVFFFNGVSGKGDTSAYFGAWNVGSRGPIPGLMDAAALNIAGITPGAPPSPAPIGAPDQQGYFVGRIVGIVTNALVLLAIGALILILRAGSLQDSDPKRSRASVRFGLLWLALSPLAFIDIGFTWPKLFAAFFVVLAFIDVYRHAHPMRIAFWAFMAYMCHPVGALFIPAIGLLAIFEGAKAREGKVTFGSLIRQSITRGAPLAISIGVYAAPWLLYKAYLGKHDVFVDYIFGDGNGFVHATSLFTWMQTRFSNLTITLVPFQFFFSPFMYGWTNGPLSQPMRFAIMYAKTLPGELGFSLIWLYYGVRMVKTDRRLAAFRNVALALSFIGMLLYWGYSNDGLGRNSLEPLTVLVIVFIATQVDRFTWPLVCSLILTSCETGYVMLAPLIEQAHTLPILPQQLSLVTVLAVTTIIVLLLVMDYVALQGLFVNESSARPMWQTGLFIVALVVIFGGLAGGIVPYVLSVEPTSSHTINSHQIAMGVRTGLATLTRNANPGSALLSAYVIASPRDGYSARVGP